MVTNFPRKMINISDQIYLKKNTVGGKNKVWLIFYFLVNLNFLRCFYFYNFIIKIPKKLKLIQNVYS